MSVTLHCPNGHDWASRVGPLAERVDQCPICGAAPAREEPATIDAEPPTVEAPPSQLVGSMSAWKSDGNTLASVPVPGYEIISELGRGGMGVVFKARQTALNRIVALKMILAGELASEGDLHRFRSEAEAAARLQHPNIVQLYEFGQARSGGVDRPYFALEYVSGGSLADRLDGTPQPSKPAATLVQSIARAMHYAHGQGVIHRDLKPGNILLQMPESHSRHGSSSAPPKGGVADYDLQSAIPKITDFGLAKRMDSLTGHTQSGAVLGTPQYMAPEQASGRSKRVGVGTDIYAIGAILYELITGRPPFQGETPLETILQVTRDEPVAPRLLNPSVPRDLETICLKCLRKPPEQRYATSLDLADDLKRFLDNQPIAARPAGPIERTRAWIRRHPTAAALIAVTTAAAITLVLVGSRSNLELRAKNAALRRQRIDLIEANGTRLADEGDLTMAMPWDAAALQLDSDDAERSANHRIRLAAAMNNSPELEAVWLHEGRVTDAAFRGDGKEVATAGEKGTVQTWEVAHPTNPIHTLSHDGAVSQVGYSDDGTKLLVRHGMTENAQKVDVWDLARQPPTRTSLPTTTSVRSVLWIPGTAHIATITTDGVQLWDAVSGQQLPIDFWQQRDVTAIAVNREGTRIAIGDRDKKVRVWNLATGQPVSPEITLADVPKILALSTDGDRLLTVAGKSARLWNVRTGQPESPELSHLQELSDGALSPNGKLVGTASIDDTGGVWDLDRHEWADNVLKHGSDLTSISFSHDGQWAVTASEDNTARVWDTKNAFPRTPPLHHVGTVSRALFSPVDSDDLLTISNDGMAKLWKLPRGMEYRKLADLETNKPHIAWSADRKLRVEASGNSAQVYRNDQPIGRLLRHGSRVNDVCMSRDGKLVATGSDDNTARVWNAETGEATTPPLPIAGSVHAVRLSRNGQQVMAAGKGPLARIWDTSTGQALAVIPRSESWVKTQLKDAAADVDWILPKTNRTPADLRDEAEWRSGHRFDSTGGLSPIDGPELLEIGKRLKK